MFACRMALPALLLALVACVPGAERLPALPQTSGSPARVHVQRSPLQAPAACSGGFVAHDLDHITAVPGAGVEMFEANGAGVAADDLDDDGDLDLVLATHAGANSILWNQGGLTFKVQRLAHGDSRAVQLVDVDGDDLLDVVFTRSLGAPNYWRNQGPAAAERFALAVLPGVARPAYAMAWGDLDGDGDLDLATGSYDAELLNRQGNSFLLGGGGGVYVYEQRADGFAASALAAESQALALLLTDLNDDLRPDILVGNDFAVPDQAWLRQGQSWTEIEPFPKTSHSTMSLDAGDIHNDGSLAIFSSDMKPYDNSVETLAVWLPLMDQMWHAPLPDDPQIMENVLLLRDKDGGYRNAAYQRGVDATGWSWSARFGDLDNDGFLDLYVVNGMAEATLFDYLPNHELIEQNQALRNDGSGYFEQMAQWRLDSTRGGRGMTMADLDLDGDLDIVVNNLRAPAQLFENRICGGDGLEVELRWPGSGNSRALGARLVLHTDSGSMRRDVRSGSGYLSGGPTRIHFGLPPGAALQRLDITWPDGAVSSIAGAELQRQMLLRVGREP